MKKVITLEFFQKAGAHGGRQRAKKLTKAQRIAIAKMAARVRWGTK